MGTPLTPTTIGPSPLLLVPSSCSSIWCTHVFLLTSLLNLMNPKVVSVGVLTSWWALLSQFCHPVPILTPSSPSLTSRRLLTLRGLKGVLFVCSMLVSAAACGTCYATSCVVQSLRFALVPLCQSLGQILFNLLVNGLIAVVWQVAPGAVLFLSASLVSSMLMIWS